MTGRENQRVATEFAETLASRIYDEFPEISVKINGDNANPHIDVQRGNRSCRVTCFPPSHGAKHLGILYLVSLREKRTRKADGRSEDLEEIFACITAWVGRQLCLRDVYGQMDFVDRNRRALRVLAEQIDEAQAEAGSKFMATVEDSEVGDIAAELWVYGNRRSCKIEPLEGPGQIKCGFAKDGTWLASAELQDGIAAAPSINLWLDRELTLSGLWGEVANLQLTDFAAEFERGEVALWNWLKMMKWVKESDHMAYALPVLKPLLERPEVSRFFLFGSVGRICFSRCSHYPFATARMPIISRAPQERFYVECNDDRIECNATDAVDFITQHLKRVSEPPFVGCASDTLLEPVNTFLSNHGSSLRVGRISRGLQSEVSVRCGDRACDLRIVEQADAPYEMYFRARNLHLSIGWYRTLEGVADALHMWLEQGCKLEDLAAVADVFTDPAYWPPYITAEDSTL